MLAIVLTIALALPACKQKQKAPLLRCNFFRADSLLFAVNYQDSLFTHHNRMAEPWALLTGYNHDPQGTKEWLLRFANDSIILAVQNDIFAHFTDLSATSSLICQGLSTLKHHLPQINLPYIYYFNSGFNASILVADSTLAIGLDRFLGTQSPYYTRLGIPKYLIRYMAPEFIPTMALGQFLDAEFPLSNPHAHILDHILNQGKKAYFVKSALPDTHDTLILPFTEKQIQWLRYNEGAIWTYLSEHKLLYSTNPRMIAQFAQPGPFTPPLGQESPGQAATYIGFRIIEKFMDRNPETPWSTLLYELTPQQLIAGAKYAPK